MAIRKLIIFFISCIYLCSCEQKDISPDEKIIEFIDELNTIGVKHYKEKNYKEAEKYFNQAIEKAAKYNLKSKLAESLNKKGTLYFQKLEKKEESIDLYDGAIKNHLLSNNPKKSAKPYYNISRVYTQLLLHESAEKSLLKAIEIYEEEKDVDMMLKSYNLMGLIQQNMLNYEKSISYHEKALELSKRNNNLKRVSYALQNMGVVYLLQENYQKATTSLNEALSIKKGLGDKKLLATTHKKLGELFLKQNKFEESESHYLKAYELRKDIDYKIGIAHSYNDLGKLYLLWGKLKKAQHCLENANLKSIQLKYNTELLLENHRSLEILSKKEKNEIDRFFHQKKIIELEEREVAISKWREITSNKIISQEESLMGYLEQLSEIIGIKRNTLIGSIAFTSILLIVITYLIFNMQKLKGSQKGEEKLKKDLLNEQSLIKNQMMEMSELINYTSSGVKEINTLNALKEVDTRMKAMMYVHKSILENLSKSNDTSQFDLSAYIKYLINYLKFAYGFPNVISSVGSQKVMINQSIASTLGLVINEILSKIFLYSFDSDTSEELKINLKKTEGMLHIQFISSGSCLPIDFDLSVREIIELIRADLVTNNEEDFSCVLSIPL